MNRTWLIAISFVVAESALAAIGDSSKVVCAMVEAVECERGQDCLIGLPEAVDAPDFVKVDLKRKTVSVVRGDASESGKIRALETSGDQSMFQGIEGTRTFSGVIDRSTGRLTATVSDNGFAFILFGSCFAS